MVCQHYALMCWFRHHSPDQVHPFMVTVLSKSQLQHCRLWGWLLQIHKNCTCDSHAWNRSRTFPFISMGQDDFRYVHLSVICEKGWEHDTLETLYILFFPKHHFTFCLQESAKVSDLNPNAKAWANHMFSLDPSGGADKCTAALQPWKGGCESSAQHSPPGLPAARCHLECSLFKTFYREVKKDVTPRKAIPNTLDVVFFHPETCPKVTKNTL